MANLTERIRKINPKAADLFTDLAYPGTTKLITAFVWKNTKQGTDYWADISLKLGE